MSWNEAYCLTKTPYIPGENMISYQCASLEPCFLPHFHHTGSQMSLSIFYQHITPACCFDMEQADP